MEAAERRKQKAEEMMERRATRTGEEEIKERKKYMKKNRGHRK